MLNEPVIDTASMPLAIFDIAVEDSSPLPIYEQICRHVRVAISNGDLPSGTQLPTSRELAGTLKVGRNTVVTAYLKLSAEGYLVTNKRRGTRVASDWKRAATPSSQPALQAEPYSEGRTRDVPHIRQSFVSISYRARDLVEERDTEEDSVPLHGPDPSLYPRNRLSHLLAEEFCRPPGSDSGNGLRRFQTAVATLLRQMRGVSCEPGEIIPVSGVEAALDLAARVVLDPGHCAYVEDPGPEEARRILKASGVRVIPLPSDARGADIARAEGPPARLIYVSPSVGFPFGHQMSEERRAELLEAARDWNAVVFESDADWELSYSGTRWRALQGRESGAAVLYLGSFGHTLGPHIKVCYLVAPKELVHPLFQAARRTACVPDGFMLGALASFVESSDYAVHTRKLRTTYSQRLNSAIAAVRNKIPDVVLLEPSGGLYLSMLLHERQNETAIVRAANARGVPVVALSRFCAEGGHARAKGLVLELGAVPDRAIESVVSRLQGVIGETSSARTGTDAFG